MHGQRNALEVWSGFGGLSIWKSFHFLLNWLYQFCPDLSENCFSYVFISGLLSGRKKYCGLCFFFFSFSNLFVNMIAHCVYSLSLFPQYGHSGNFPCLCGSLKKNQENVTASPQSLAGCRLYRLQTSHGWAFCICTLFSLGLQVHGDGGSPGWQEESRATHGVLSEELHAPVCTQRLSIILTGAHKPLMLRDTPGARDTLTLCAKEGWWQEA